VFGTSVGNASIVIMEEETYPGSDLDGASGCGAANTTWPKHDQITNSFFWGNTFNGAEYNYPVQNGLMPSGYFKEGRDYWRHPPNSTNVLKDYVPLVYPHPLVTAQDLPTNSPIMKASPSSLNFGNVVIGTTAQLSITVQNIGNGTLSGVASVNPPFIIGSGGSYSLAAGQNQVIAIRYSPGGVTHDVQNVTLSGGGGGSVALQGSGVNELARVLPPTNLRVQ
jgi:hypothetical protein